MKDPCTTCVRVTSRSEGHRRFIGCSDLEMKKGFHNDTYFYHHTCANHEARPECLKCLHYLAPYCESVYADCAFQVK